MSTDYVLKIVIYFLCEIFSNNDNELALYDSIDEGKEEEEKPCCFCAKNIIDPIKFGKKMTIADITAHHFCLVSLVVHRFMFTVRNVHWLVSADFHAMNEIEVIPHIHSLLV